MPKEKEQAFKKISIPIFLDSEPQTMPVLKEPEIAVVEETSVSTDIENNEESGEPILLTYKPLAEHRFTNPHILSQMVFNEFGVLVRKKENLKEQS